MKDVFNLLVLLVILLVMAMRVTNADADMAKTLDLMMLTLCAVCGILSAVLGVARMIVRRRALMPIVWSVVYLIVGCCVWTISFKPVEQGEAEVSFLELVTQYRAGGSPWLQNEQGDSLPALAAALGEKRVLKEILQAHGSDMPLAMKIEAAHAAASAGKVSTLEMMLETGVPVDACHDSTSLLNAAAQNGMTDVMLVLLRRNANVNLADDEGTTPLMNAAMTDRPTPVRLLLKYGADVSLRDKSGRDAASYARSEDIVNLLSPEN